MSGDPAPALGEIVDFHRSIPPERVGHHGAVASVRPLDPARDAQALYDRSHPPNGDPSVWRYLPTGPYPDRASYRAALEEQTESRDALLFVITTADDDRPLGQISYMSIVPEHGRIELGNIWFSGPLKRSAAATEAVFLLAKHAFEDLGNRRLEWKCNALNEPSRRAAVRFGFEYEGVFRNHQVVKGHNRDTAWYAITDQRWPAIRSAFEAWLAPANFDSDGTQIASLRQMTANLELDSALR
jgi:RimJ/RimL family protein N-acetyltransferase